MSPRRERGAKQLSEPETRGAPPPPVFPSTDAWAQALGLEILEWDETRVLARLMAGPQHHQPMGVLHGGVYASIVETVASYGAGRSVMASGQAAGVLGVSNSTDFLRSHSEGELLAEGVPLHQGRSAQIWEVRITRADGKLVSRGQVRFHVLQHTPVERREAGR